MPSAADLIKVAHGEVGYLEKATNANLNSKTANAGNNNWTKYGAWYGLNGGSKAPWCAMFVSWCAYKINATNIVGKSAAVAQFRAFHQNLGQYHTRGKYRPKAGDLIIFSGDSHIGIVTSSSSSTVYTIEGNTSAGRGVVANGQGVFQKSYSLNYSRIAGYASPKYTSSSSSTEYGTPDHYGATVVRSTSFYMHSYSNTSRPSIPLFKSKFQRDLDCSTVPYLFIPATYSIKGKKGGNWVGAIALVVDNIKKKVLILDDSTSAVDTATDAKIRKAFATEIPGTTKIIIAQRISSIQDADRIIVMDNGRIDAFAPHEELLRTNNIYKEVYEAQTQTGGGDFDENGGES